MVPQKQTEEFWLLLETNSRRYVFGMRILSEKILIFERYK